MEKALIIGDTHGNRRYLEKVIALAEKKECDGVIVCGDFGYWPTHRFTTVYAFDRAFIYNTPKSAMTNGEDIGRSIVEGEYDLPVYFVDGNHEYFTEDGLLQYKEPINEIAPNLFYVPRGHVHEFGRMNVLFMGGGSSIDKASRTKGLDWFEEEHITEEQVDRAISFKDRVHVIISHDCPLAVNIGFKPLALTMRDREMLDIVYKKVRPEFWFFGHYHVNDKIHRDGTLFRCLPADINESYDLEGVVFDFVDGAMENVSTFF